MSNFETIVVIERISNGVAYLSYVDYDKRDINGTIEAALKSSYPLSCLAVLCDYKTELSQYKYYYAGFLTDNGLISGNRVYHNISGIPENLYPISAIEKYCNIILQHCMLPDVPMCQMYKLPVLYGKYKAIVVDSDKLTLITDYDYYPEYVMLCTLNKLIRESLFAGV